MQITNGVIKPNVNKYYKGGARSLATSKRELRYSAPNLIWCGKGDRMTESSKKVCLQKILYKPFLLKHKKAAILYNKTCLDFYFKT